MDLLIIIIVLIGIGVIISNQYSGLKKMDGIQYSLDKLNQKKMVSIRKQRMR